MQTASSLQIVDHSPQPKYLQLADHFRQQITNQKLQGRTHLPSINLLSARYDVSRDTVRKAYMELKRTNLVEGVRGKGYFVRSSTKVEVGRSVILCESPASPEITEPGMWSEEQQHTAPRLYCFHGGDLGQLRKLASGILRASDRVYVSGSFSGFSSVDLRRALSAFDPANTTVVLGRETPLCIPHPGIDLCYGDMLFGALKSCSEPLGDCRQIALSLAGRSALPKLLLPGLQRYSIRHGVRATVMPPDDSRQVVAGTCYVLTDFSELSERVQHAQAAGLRLGRDVFFLYVGYHAALPSLAGGITSVHPDLEGSLAVLSSVKASSAARRHSITTGKLVRRTSL